TAAGLRRSQQVRNIQCRQTRKYSGRKYCPDYQGMLATGIDFPLASPLERTATAIDCRLQSVDVA
ncbi:hypothetical protein, partial [Proteus mirabilis]